MINKDAWISSLPNNNIKNEGSNNQLNNEKWIKTIPKVNKQNSIKKYSLIIVLFVSGLLFVSIVKNESRNLQVNIDNLEKSINLIKFNLDQAILDNEVITSPENISRLAKEYLSNNFVTYKKSQIKYLKNENKDSDESVKITSYSYNEKQDLKKKLKLTVTDKIEKKKTEIRKLKELYSQPEEIPGAIKTKVVQKIEEKKIELTKIYSSPKSVISDKKVQKWAAVQVVKVFLGMPIVPGK